MFLESNVLTQPFSMRACAWGCVCLSAGLSVWLGSLLTLIGVDLPEYLIAAFLAAVSLHEKWVG